MRLFVNLEIAILVLVCSVLIGVEFTKIGRGFKTVVVESFCQATTCKPPVSV